MKPRRAGWPVTLLLAAVLLGPLGAAEPDEAARSEAPPAPSWDLRVGAVASPGPLARVHKDLEGITRCTQCHTWMGGTPDGPCLACHEAVGERVAQGLGFHGGLRGECAACHADHRGREADVLGLDRKGFNHDLALFSLRGAHADVACDDCHVTPREEAEPPFFHAIGIAHDRCSDCHADPHGERLVRARACSACHGDVAWNLPVVLDREAGRGFDHDADTRFPLDAVHVLLDCGACHRAEAETPPARECAACHEDAVALLSGRLGGLRLEPDPHTGTVTCRDCHPASMKSPGLPAYAAVCTECHPASYASLLATRRAIVDAALVAAAAGEPDARTLAWIERLARSGLHHPALAEALAGSLRAGAPR